MQEADPCQEAVMDLGGFGVHLNFLRFQKL